MKLLQSHKFEISSYLWKKVFHIHLAKLSKTIRTSKTSRRKLKMIPMSWMFSLWLRKERGWWEGSGKMTKFKKLGRLTLAISKKERFAVCSFQLWLWLSSVINTLRSWFKNRRKIRLKSKRSMMPVQARALRSKSRSKRNKLDFTKKTQVMSQKRNQDLKENQASEGKLPSRKFQAYTHHQ